MASPPRTPLSPSGKNPASPRGIGTALIMSPAKPKHTEAAFLSFAGKVRPSAPGEGRGVSWRKMQRPGGVHCLPSLRRLCGFSYFHTTTPARSRFIIFLSRCMTPRRTEAGIYSRSFPRRFGNNSNRNAVATGASMPNCFSRRVSLHHRFSGGRRAGVSSLTPHHQGRKRHSAGV